MADAPAKEADADVTAGEAGETPSETKWYKKPFVFKGVLCSYCALDFGDIKLGCRSQEELCCLVRECCIAPDEKPLGLGLVTNPENNEFCKIGLYCITCGLKYPETLCKEAFQLLFIKSASSFPLDEDYVNEYLCTIFFIQCVRGTGSSLFENGVKGFFNFGFMEPFESPIFEKPLSPAVAEETMERE